MRTRLDFNQMYWSREARRTYIYTNIRNTRCPIGLFVCIHASMHTYAKYLCPEHKVHTLVGWGWSRYSCPEHNVLHTLLGWGGRYEHLHTNTHTRTQRTYSHEYVCSEWQRSLHRNWTFAITRQASMASASLLDFGASSNATTQKLAENGESPRCAARQRTLQQTQERSTKNCSWMNEQIYSTLMKVGQKDWIHGGPCETCLLYIASSPRKLQTVSRLALPDTGGDHLSGFSPLLSLPQYGSFRSFRKSNQEIKG
jgi:hypothetical protein